MNKKLFVIIVLIIVAVGGGLAYLASRDSSTENPVASQVRDNPKVVPSDKMQPTENAGTYKEYSEDTFAATTGTRILFFHASWCPQCRQLESDIKDGTIPEDVTIFKVDYDNSQKLRQEYGVTLQTTLVKVDSNGNEIKKFVAYDDPSLDALVRNLL